ncbi:hypothetical protein D9M71_367880 [compost metagenome]
MRLGDGAFDHASHAVAVLGGDQWAELGARVVLQAVLDAGHGHTKLFHKLVVDAFLRINAAGSGAVLPGVIEAKGTNAFDRRIDVGVVEDDHWGLAAQFHVHALDAVGGAGNDVRAGSDRACQRDHAHFRVGHQRAAHGRATAEHQVEHAGREDLGGQLAQAQGGQRGLLGGLEHHRVAGGQGRGDFPGDHHQRVVPRRDGGDHAHRVAADHRGVARQVFTGGRAAHAAVGPGKEAEHVGNGRDFVVQRCGVRLAAVVRFQLGQFFAVGFDGVGQFQQQ